MEHGKEPDGRVGGTLSRLRRGVSGLARVVLDVLFLLGANLAGMVSPWFIIMSILAAGLLAPTYAKEVATIWRAGDRWGRALAISDALAVGAATVVTMVGGLAAWSEWPVVWCWLVASVVGSCGLIHASFGVRSHPPRHATPKGAHCGV